jgi:acyl-CoA thioester hydrolase
MPATCQPRVGWPRVRAACEYKHPLHFEDETEIHLLVQEKRSKAITYLIKFRRVHPEPAIEVARGTVTIVCVHHHADGHMSAMTIPADISAKIEVAPPQLLK